jgi:hypothetical protein
MSYIGNKREEVERIYEAIDFTGIDTIIEPFAGSSAISYYIWTKRPDLKFILNDSNKMLLEMFHILRDKDKTEALEKAYKDFFTVELTKEVYNNIVKQDNVPAWFLKNKYYNIQPGLFPLGKTVSKVANFEGCPITKFYREADITFLSQDAVPLIEKYKDNPSCALILDPPYINTSNEFYDYDEFNQEMNIYEYLSLNKIKGFKCYIMAIFENNWIIRLLFRGNTIIEYDKTYIISKKKTKHFLITK